MVDERYEICQRKVMKIVDERDEIWQMKGMKYGRGGGMKYGRGKE